MKVLLFGAAGQLGQEWQHFLTPREPKYLLIPYTSSQLDITFFDDVNHEIEQHQPDLIINGAAYTKVDDAEDEPEKAFEINAQAVKNIAEICRDLDIKLIHFSTDYIFAGRREDQTRFPEGYPENHPADPINLYGQTKWEGEQAIREAGCRHLILRVAWLCGAHGGNFVKTMLRLSDKYEELRVVDDQIGSPTFAHSLVRNTLHLIEQGKQGTFHYTSEGKISWADFAEAIFYIAGKNVEVNRVPSSEYETKAKRPFYSKLNTDKIAQERGAEIQHWNDELKTLLKKIEDH